MRKNNLREIVLEFAKDKYMCIERLYDTEYINVCLEENSGVTNRYDLKTFRKENVDMIIFIFEYFDVSKTEMRIYKKTRSSTWIMSDEKGNSYSNKYRGISHIMDFEDILFTTHKYKKNELKNIRVFGLNIGDSLNKRNIKLNDSFLDDPKFQELKENNFFGVKCCSIRDFRHIKRQDKLSPDIWHYFTKANLFDTALECKGLYFEFEELFKTFYVDGIYYCTTNDGDDIVCEWIENKNVPIRMIDVYFDELYPMIKEYFN